MIKVFLVEDEYVIREGIKKNIDWQAHGYEFCGEAGDGELAFPMIQEIRPEIVITDIRMPFMDGLALSRLIKKEFPETEIIILREKPHVSPPTKYHTPPATRAKVITIGTITPDILSANFAIGALEF